MSKKKKNGDTFLMVRYQLIEKLGPIQAVLLEHLIDLQKNIFEGEFYQQQHRISKRIGISIDVLKSNIKKLKDNGYIKVCKKSVDGQVSKNYYKVNLDVVNQLFNEETSVENPLKLSGKSTIVEGKIHSTLSEKSTQASVENPLTKTISNETISKERISNNTTSNNTITELDSIIDSNIPSAFISKKEIRADEFDKIFNN